jgi:hypothetical protein
MILPMKNCDKCGVILWNKIHFQSGTHCQIFNIQTILLLVWELNDSKKFSIIQLFELKWMSLPRKIVTDGDQTNDTKFQFQAGLELIAGHSTF